MKAKIKKIFSALWKGASGMPVTVILVLASAVTAAVFITDNLDFRFEVITYVCLFLLLTAVGSFFAENAFKKIPVRAAVITAFALFSSFFSNVLWKNPFNWSEAFIWHYFVLYGIFYASAALITGVYFCIRNNGQAVTVYAAGAFMNLLRVEIIIGLLLAGVMFLILIINVLLYESESLAFRAVFLIGGGLGVNGAFIAFRNIQEEKGKLARILISYICCPICACAYVIIYVYMAKILITQTVPSNMVFGILTAVFFVSAPVFLMTEAVNNNSFFRVGLKILHFLFIPLMLLQGWSIGLRILDYGITPRRYFGLMIIVLELIWLLFTLIRPKLRSLIFIAASILLAAALVIPGINCRAVSRVNQTALLRKYEESKTYKAAEKALGALEYLAEEPDEIATILSGITEDEKAGLEDEIREILGESDGSDMDIDILSRSYDCFEYPSDPISVEGFSAIRECSAYETYWDSAEDKVDLTSVSIELAYTDEYKTADLEDLVNKCTAYLTDSDEDSAVCPEEYRIVELPDGDTLYVIYMYVSGRESDGEFIITSLDLDGMILYR